MFEGTALTWVTYALGIVAVVLFVAQRRAQPASDKARPWQRDWANWLSLVARVTLGGILVWAGGAKVGALELSVDTVAKYQLLPVFGLVRFVGYALPIGELILGGLILAGAFTRWTAALGGLLMLVYVPVIISLWARGIWMDCGCGGGEAADLAADEAKLRYVLDILRDLMLALLGAWLVRHPRSRPSVDQWLLQPLPDEPEPEPARSDRSQTGRRPARRT
ncbi:MAG: DoxX family protein [Propionibacteriaceae bacterium]|nr:DoxX family protein [Propionibacteriaceae bacterium]